jgi:hypothetical protein
MQLTKGQIPADIWLPEYLIEETGESKENMSGITVNKASVVELIKARMLDGTISGGSGGGAVTSVAGKTGVVTLVPADVALSNVDNTSDAAKPISTATQTALNDKLTANTPISAATKTKITYAANGLVTAGSDATNADILTSAPITIAETTYPTGTTVSLIETALAAAATPDWKLVGNTGTIAGTNFIGTTDAIDFVTKTNNVERVRIKGNSGFVGIGATTNAQNTLEVTSSAADTSGLRITNLTSTSPTSTGGAIGVDGNGDIVRITASGATTRAVVGTARIAYETLTGTPVLTWTKTGGVGTLAVTGGTIQLCTFSDTITVADTAANGFRFDMVGTGTDVQFARSFTPAKYTLNATDALADASSNATVSNQVDIDNTPPVKYGNINITGQGSMSIRTDNVTTDTGYSFKW